MNKFFLFVMFCFVSVYAATPTGLTATHRHGQTFLVWNDVSGAEEYYIYRSTAALSSSDLTPANRVGEIESNSSEITEWAQGSPNITTAVGSDYYRITDSGTPLTASDELFVWTTQESSGGTFYYVVTAVSSGNEDATAASGNTVGPVSESECAMIHPVEQWRSADSTGRVYMMWMPFDKWNRFFYGYTHPFYVAGTSFEKKRLELKLHGASDEYNSWLSGSGPKSAGNLGAYSYHVLYTDDPYLTQHYGFADSHTGTPSTGTTFDCSGATVVKNYTEYRYWCSIRWLCSEYSPFPSDSDEVTVRGGSMGGAGTIIFSIHHPDIFAYCNSFLCINNWTTNSMYRTKASIIGYGTTLPCVDLIDKNALIGNRDVGMSAIGWMSARDSVLPLVGRNDRDICFYRVSHGTQDGVIEWTTQGVPIYSDHGGNAFAANYIPYSAGWADVGHSGTGDAGLNESGNVPKNHFVLALKNAESDDALDASCLTDECSDDGQFNARVLWSKKTDAQNTAIETAETLETTITLETDVLAGVSYTGPSDPTVDITPRRLNHLIYTPGTIYKWKNTASGGSIIDSGTVTANENGIFTIEAFEFSAAGNRLQVVVDSVPPNQVNKEFIRKGLNQIVVTSILKSGIPVVFRNGTGKSPDKIIVYTVDGCRMKMPVVNGKLVWSERELGGRPVSSGIYILSGVFGNRMISRRAVFIK